MSTTNELHKLSCLAAFELLQKEPSTTLIDIRSTMEYLFVGHPIGAIHIPWIDEPDWSINHNFSSDILELVKEKKAKEEIQSNVPIILICRSGNRSHQAGLSLIANGLTNIYHIDEGFEGDRDANFHRSTIGGWRYHELPWEQC